MNTVTRWWLVRHAPVLDQGGRIYGQSDPACDLSDVGCLRTRAQSLPRTAVWLSSHLRRAIDTAEALAEMEGLDTGTMLTVRELAEQSWGEWEKFTWNELRQARDERVLSFWRNPAVSAPPGGESFLQVIERTGKVLTHLSERFAGQDIIAVMHAGTVRGALAAALNLEPHAALSFQIDPLSLTRLDYIHGVDGPSVWRISGVNIRADA